MGPGDACGFRGGSEREMERFMVDPHGEMVSVCLELSSTAVTEIKNEPTA